MGYGPYNKTNDIGRADWEGVRHENFVPKSPEDVEAWLDDTGALSEAEAYRFLDKEIFRGLLQGAAERIYLDVRGDFYTASEATEMYLRRQAEGHLGSYSVMISDGERYVMPTTVDPAA